MLRPIYSGINTEDGYRKRTNKELHIRYKELEITSAIEFQRLKWLGHIVEVWKWTECPK